MVRGSEGSAQWRGALHPLTPTPCLVETGACAIVTATHRRGLATVLTGTQSRPSVPVGEGLCLVTHTLVHATRQAHVCTHSQMPTATHPQAHVITVSTVSRAQTSMCSPRSTAAQTHMGVTRSLLTRSQVATGSPAPPPGPAQTPPTHQVLGRLGQHGKGGQVLALAAGEGCLGLQGLAALGVPVP